MAAPAPNSILDKIDATTAGMHSGLPPFAIARNQLAMAVNITNRGSRPKTRPVYRKIALTYENETVESRATQAIFQGAIGYSAYGNNQNCILSQIGGRTFRYLISNNSAMVGELVPDGPLNDPTSEQAWLWQAEDFVVINDGKSYPLFFDGASIRRSAGPAGKELPPGTVGRYCNGRIVMALPDQRSYIAGDLVYQQSGTPQYNYRDSVLKITENIAILGGRAFAVPINAGPINAMFSVAILDTSLGQGPLQIGTRQGVFSTNLPFDVTQWTTTQQPSQTVSLTSFGPLSYYGVSVVNSDAWYRAQDGIRSFAVARRDLNTWVHTPLSYEVETIIKSDTEQLLNHCSSVNFDNRLLTTCSPYRVPDRGIAHRGSVVLDFNNVSSITVRSQPAYDGLWTGLPILQYVSATIQKQDRCFVFALDENDDICLYELLKDGGGLFDFDGENDVPVESWIVSNALFGMDIDPPIRTVPMKKLMVSDIFANDLAGNVEFDVKYRSDQYPFWVDWKTFSICAPYKDCTQGDCVTFLPVQQQYATFKRLPEPQDECHPISKRLLRSGYYFQIRLQWTGHAELHKMLVWAMPIPETIQNVC
jgi:hypothetical protein